MIDFIITNNGITYATCEDRFHYTVYSLIKTEIVAFNCYLILIAVTSSEEIRAAVDKHSAPANVSDPASRVRGDPTHIKLFIEVLMNIPVVSSDCLCCKQVE